MNKIIFFVLCSVLGHFAMADGAPCPEGLNCGYDTCYPCPDYKAPAAAPQCGWNYDCISGRMEALNSSIYYAWTPAQIDTALKNKGEMGHDLAVQLAVECQLTNK